MSGPPARRGRRLPFATAIAAYLLVVMGGVVRATGSGLGCPDWPTCEGSWFPPLERTALIEYLHRSLAGLVGVLAVGMGTAAWRRRRRERQRAWLAAIVLVLLALQAYLGRAVVLAELEPALVTIHLGLALLLLGLLAAMALPDAAPLGRWRPGVSLLLPIGVLAVALVGAAVRAEYATLAYLDWPLMDGSFLPIPSDTPHLLQLLHRATAGALVAGSVLWTRWARRHAPGLLATLGTSLVWLLVVQAALGAWIVVGRIPTLAVIGHVAVGTATWVVALLIPAFEDQRRGPHSAVDQMAR